MISSGSYSRIKVFETCKYKAFLQYDQRIPEPERPLPQGKSEHANDRGTRIHEAAEAYVRGQGPMTHEMRHFRPEFEKLQRLFSAGSVSLEGEWGHDRDWEPCDWRKAWLRLKLDALVHLDNRRAVVIDYKSGAMYGNEIAHAEQAQLYQLCAFLRHPELEEIITEFWYLDHNEIKPMKFRRDQGLRFRRNWENRLTKMTTAIDFPPSPSIYACRHCWYSMREGGTGDCERGVIP